MESGLAIGLQGDSSWMTDAAELPFDCIPLMTLHSTPVERSISKSIRIRLGYWCCKKRRGYPFCAAFARDLDFFLRLIGASRPAGWNRLIAIRKTGEICSRTNQKQARQILEEQARKRNTSGRAVHARESRHHKSAAQITSLGPGSALRGLRCDGNNCWSGRTTGSP